MAVTVRVFDHAAQVDRQITVPDALLQEVASFVLESVAFRQMVQTGQLRDVDLMRQRWKRWQSAMRDALNAHNAAPPAIASTDWIESARARREAGATWSELEREFGVSAATVRRRLGVLKPASAA